MTSADRTFELVIDEEGLDCVMCSSDQIERRMNVYRDEVGGSSGWDTSRMRTVTVTTTKGGEGGVGTTTTPSTSINVTRKDKKKSATTMAENKNKKKNPPLPCWVVVLSHRPERLLRYFECDAVGSDEFTSIEFRVYTVPMPRW